MLKKSLKEGGRRFSDFSSPSVQFYGYSCSAGSFAQQLQWVINLCAKPGRRRQSPVLVHHRAVIAAIIIIIIIIISNGSHAGIHRV